MAKKTEVGANQPPTERAIAPETPTYAPPAPRQMRVERQGAQGVAYSRRFPEIRGGICEFCGVLDPKVESKFQYKLCPHYRGMQAWCSYCHETTDPDETVYHERLKVAEDPNNPGSLIMWCDKYDCAQAHLKRFKTNVL